MSTPKHTPGPWCAVLTGRRERNISMVAPGAEGDGFSIRAVSTSAPAGQRIGFVPSDYVREDNTEGVSDMAIANARLIAAAPELLEALRHLDIVTRGHPEVSEEEIDELEATYTGDANTPWGELVQRVRDAARAALAKAEMPQ